MSISTIRTATFTITDARYIGAKIGTDLRLLNNLYGRPSLADIADYTEEAALLIKDGYLNTVAFGFRDEDVWKLRLRYTATLGGELRDDPPGRLPEPAHVAGLTFYSFLTYSQKFLQLPSSSQSAVKLELPVIRTTATEPGIGTGSHASGHGYGRNGAGVTRDTYSAY